MKFAVISSSHRQKSQSAKVAKFVESALQAQDKGNEVFFYSLAGSPLPFWDDGIWDNTEFWQKAWGGVKKEIASCDAIVIVVPEWHGMAPGGIKNFLHLCATDHVIAHKPGLLIGVSASLGGAYPVAELRMTGGKNTRICFIPDHVIVRHAEKVLNPGEPASDEDRYIRGRIAYSLKVLHQYGLALRQVRESGVIDTKAYPNGM